MKTEFILTLQNTNTEKGSAQTNSKQAMLPRERKLFIVNNVIKMKLSNPTHRSSAVSAVGREGG